MTTPPAPGQPVGSPCINICHMDQTTGCCEGCQRTLAEIAAWGSLGDEGRLAIWSQLAQRRLRNRQVRRAAAAAAAAGERGEA